MEQLGCNWTDFREIWYLIIFRKAVEKIQVSLQSDKNNVRALYMQQTDRQIWWYNTVYRWILLRMRNVADRSWRGNQGTLCMVNFLYFFRKSCRLWLNVEKYCTVRQATDDNTIGRMSFACWITKATDSHSEYAIIIALPLQQWLHERTSTSRYTHIACVANSDYNFAFSLCTPLSQTRSWRLSHGGLTISIFQREVPLPIWK